MEDLEGLSLFLLFEGVEGEPKDVDGLEGAADEGRRVDERGGDDEEELDEGGGEAVEEIVCDGTEELQTLAEKGDSGVEGDELVGRGG